MAKKKLDRIVEEKEDAVIDAILDGKEYSSLCDVLGLKNRAEFQRYLLQFPDFLEECDRAWQVDNRRLEATLLKMHTQISDPAKLRVYADNVKSILKFRDRQRYGDKTETTINMNVDIAGALARAEKRVTGETIDVPKEVKRVEPAPKPKVELKLEIVPLNTPVMEINQPPKDTRVFDQALGPPIPKPPK